MSQRLAVMRAAAWLLLFPASASPAIEPAHDREIKLFASTMAIAKTVKESCPGIEPDDRLLETLRLHLHVVETDRPVFAPQAHAAAETLKKARDEAPGKEAWCKAVFRLYGPDGKLLRGLLRGR